MKFEHIFGEELYSTEIISTGTFCSCYKIIYKSDSFFLKEYTNKYMSTAEVNGLKEIGLILDKNIPVIYYVDDYIIVLKYINQVTKHKNYQRNLGEIVSLLHSKTSEKYGFFEDNFIGSNKQINTYNNKWTDFYIKNRLNYQIQLAEQNQYYDVVKSYEKLAFKLPDLLESDYEKPCLLHGDLWVGNIMCNEIGRPILIDPGVYYGNRELELVMTKLFGGFTKDFYDAYFVNKPLKYGWKDRENIYTLYHILNHLNIFGESYKPQALNLIKYYL